MSGASMPVLHAEQCTQPFMRGRLPVGLNFASDAVSVPTGLPWSATS